MGWSELIIIVVVLVILFGDKKVKKMSRELGKSAKKFKEVKRELEVTKTDINKTIKELKQDL